VLAAQARIGAGIAASPKVTPKTGPKKQIRIILVLSFAAPVVAGQFEDGSAAYARGD
jgi:hypothetical protein